MFGSYVALGDSFTEGMGDELPNGLIRGWADLVALGLGQASGAPIRYANLAIRGKKVNGILTEQVEPTVRMRPELVSLNGGGNDIMRVRVSIARTAKLMIDAAERLRDAGSHVLLVCQPNPGQHLPLGALLSSRGHAVAAEIRSRVPEGVTLIDNWSDPALSEGRYWADDNLHLNTLGHTRVAATVLQALNVPVPVEWAVDEVARWPDRGARRRDRAYYLEYVLPWVVRRVTGRSAGDGKSAKLPLLETVQIPGPERPTRLALS
ncbi:lysophospholipase L1-like esterase [Mycetocola sp. BIGb0189]|uniref:SGNH/GDSL hydrolase family protein n=1 Tax=Mycetocola sp. BIGb0189 TaxID=2940604 RepID=UPI0021675F12|nr:SGNH/GDSL hydrolase family protein [Mycetocola sp. BIGb0189]MCS4275127.1 lysophospholipase L1-like esterase [Mycetocola sp. BIGb0189]